VSLSPVCVGVWFSFESCRRSNRGCVSVDVHPRHCTFLSIKIDPSLSVVVTSSSGGVKMIRIPRKTMARLALLAFVCSMAFGSWMMIESSLSYLDLGDVHPFFLEKLPLPSPDLWLNALYLHVPSALFALPACILLRSRIVLRRFPRFHRYLGRVTGLVILLVVVPSGAYLAFFAKGGWPSTLGFLLSGAIVFVAMVKSIQEARNRRFKEHRRYSTHVLAQLCVAVISRVALVLSTWVPIDFESAYIAALWIPVVGGIVVAEIVARPSRSGHSTYSHPNRSGGSNENRALFATLGLDRFSRRC
jgi:hypothetical protein